MKSVSLLLLIAIVFGAAAMWQSRRVAALEAERARAMAIQAGELADTASGEVRAGWGVVTIGRPSGVPSTRDPSEGQQPLGATGSDVAGAEAELGYEGGYGSASDPSHSPDDVSESPDHDWLGDYELEVAPGLTLASITATHYGTASTELVAALARYNGLADPDELAVGQRLRLPPLDLLLR